MECTEGDILSVTIGYNYHVSHLYSLLQLLELLSHASPHLVLLTRLGCRQLLIHSFTHQILIEGLGKPRWLRQAWFCPGAAYILDVIDATSCILQLRKWGPEKLESSHSHSKCKSEGWNRDLWNLLLGCLSFTWLFLWGYRKSSPHTEAVFQKLSTWNSERILP